MTADPPRLFLVTYKPLVASVSGRDASKQFGLPPFIDGSIRREPDLEHVYPSISCLCRTDRFAPRLRPADLVVYLTQKARYGGDAQHRRLTGVLRVLRLFDAHADAAAWYRDKGLSLPSNCMVADNPSFPVSHSHRQHKRCRHPDDEAFRRCWDMGYKRRARRHGRFVVCEPRVTALDWDAPMLHDKDLEHVFGQVPGTRNPGALDATLLPALLERAGVAPPSCR